MNKVNLIEQLDNIYANLMELKNDENDELLTDILSKIDDIQYLIEQLD